MVCPCNGAIYHSKGVISSLTINGLIFLEAFILKKFKKIIPCDKNHRMPVRSLTTL